MKIPVALTRMSAVVLMGLATISVAEEQVTNPAYCIGCHEDRPMLGVHSGKQFGKYNLVAACADCHGAVSDLDYHEADGLDVLSFSYATEEEPQVVNQACMSCHDAEENSAAHWTHDAHGEQLACSSCHSLHSTNDPVRGLTRKATIKLCVDCHSEQTLASEGADK